MHGAQEEVFILSLSLIFLLVNPFFALAEESITITTYYPSPYGVYRELRSQRMAIGDNYIDGAAYCWDGTCTNTINTNADLVVEGNVGIGTTGPIQELDVNGDIILSGLNTTRAIYGSWNTGTPINRPILGFDSGGPIWIRSIDNDATDGIYFKSYGGTNLAVILDSGNVGIGTTDPGSYGGQQSKLDVNGYAAANDVWLKNVGKWASQLEAVKAGVLVYSCPNQRAADESGCIGQLTLESFCYWCTRQDRGSCKRWTTKPCIPVGQLVE